MCFEVQLLQEGEGCCVHCPSPSQAHPAGWALCWRRGQGNYSAVNSDPRNLWLQWQVEGSSVTRTFLQNARVLTTPLIEGLRLLLGFLLYSVLFPEETSEHPAFLLWHHQSRLCREKPGACGSQHWLSCDPAPKGRHRLHLCQSPPGSSSSIFSGMFLVHCVLRLPPGERRNIHREPQCRNAYRVLTTLDSVFFTSVSSYWVMRFSREGCRFYLSYLYQHRAR